MREIVKSRNSKEYEFSDINLPNALSFSRIVLSFGIILSLLGNRISAAVFILVIAGITDFLDGYTARKYNLVSQFGATLDPLADKVMMFLIYLAAAFVNLIPMYVAIIVILRDVIILSGVIICFFGKIPLKMGAIKSSKINTVVQIFYLFFVLSCNCFHLHITSVLGVLTLAVVGTTIWSGVEYVQKYRWIWPIIFK